MVRRPHLPFSGAKQGPKGSLRCCYLRRESGELPHQAQERSQFRNVSRPWELRQVLQFGLLDGNSAILNFVPNPRQSIAGKAELFFAESDAGVECRLEYRAHSPFGKRTIEAEQVVDHPHRIRHGGESDVRPTVVFVEQLSPMDAWMNL